MSIKKKKLSVLHLSNDYSGSTVYKSLVGELDNLGLSQIVYNPIKEESRIGANKIDLKVKDSEIIYSHILNKTTDRIFYKRKIEKIVKDIESKIDLTKINFIHAHTWFSDGGVAYLLSKKHNIPYIVAVRNTDLNVHYKYFIHYRKFGSDILNRANNIILIGEYQKKFFNSKTEFNNISNDKIKVVPNGVDEFWIKNSKEFTPQRVDKFKILYVGTFIERKKIVELQQAVIELFKNNDFSGEVHIVGGGGSQTARVLANIRKYPFLFTYHGKIKDQEKLKAIYRSSFIFAMPSQYETFGLVYVEAMLQGLPILYTENEGIDGFYNENIGERIVSADTEEIKVKLLRLIKNYDSYVIPTEKLRHNHDWQNIASIYVNLYSSK